MPKRFVCRVIAIVAAVACGAARGLATPSQSADAAFELASVKENRIPSHERGGATTRMLPGGRYEARAITVAMLIGRAYELRPYQIVGGPDWINETRFDILAKAPDRSEARTATSPATRTMLRRLLAERFHLSVRRDSKKMSSYSLGWAKAPGQLGPGIRRISAACDAWSSDPDRRAAAGPIDAPACPTEIGLGPGLIWIKGNSLSTFIGSLASELGRPVVDDTGLQGRYDVDLSFAPDPELSRLGKFPTADITGQNIFTAVREQLGLKLTPIDAPIDVVVIERVERPIED
jgi:uncharacterized protein (TIGR03435 family)